MLIALFVARDLRPWRVAVGYLGAAWVVAGSAWAGSKLLESVPLMDLGILGAIPLGLGIARAWKLRRPARGVTTPEPNAAAGVVMAALLTLAQSADNGIVLLSLFADTADELDGLLFATLAICAALWCALAFWLARHSPLAGVLQRALRLALPFVLIAVGTYILGHTVTDVLARGRIGAHQGREEHLRVVADGLRLLRR